MTRAGRPTKTGTKRNTVTLRSFDSVLGLDARDLTGLQRWLYVARIVLFLEPASSSVLRDFVSAGQEQSERASDESDVLSLFQLCTELGRDLMDDMLWIVLKAADEDGSISRGAGLLLCEHLVAGCSTQNGGALIVKDPMIVWELYNLAQFIPEEDASLLEDVELRLSSDACRDLPR